MRKSVLTALLLAALVTSANSAFAQNGRPLTLNEAVAMALRDNSVLRNAERRTQVAGTDVTEARAGILPSLSFSLSVSNSHSAGLSLSQPLFDFGANWNRIRQADAAKSGSAESYESAKQNTILLVHRHYWDYLKELRLLKVSEDAVKSSEEQLKRTEKMFALGSVAQGDLFRARTTYGNDRIDLISQKNQVNNARGLLNVVLGRPTDAELSIVDIEAEPQFRDDKLDEVLKVALEKNSELAGLKYEMQRARLGRKIARTAYLPSLSVSANYGRSNNDPRFTHTDFRKNWDGSIKLGVNWNLFNGLSDHAQVEREAINYRIAEEEYFDRVRNLRLEAEQTLLSLQSWKEIIAINNENVTSAREDLRLAEERYRVGAGTLLDIINAQVNVTRSSATLVRAKYDSMIALSELQAIMGTLGR